MMRRRSLAGSVGILAAAATAAEAHSPFKGANDFYTGLLHPLVVPGEALAIVALALLLGTSGAAASRLGLALLVAGLVAGLSYPQFASASPAWTTPVLLAAALVMAAIVTAGLRPPAAAAGLFALFAGAVVGVDAAPQEVAIGSALLASAATVIGGLTIAIMIAGTIVNRHEQWLRVATRVAGSWITASAMLYFAWFAATPR